MSEPDAPRYITWSPEVLFRYQVVSQVVAGIRAGKRLPLVVKEVAGRPHLSGHIRFRLRKVSVRSIYRWLAAFNAGGVDALEPTSREHTSTSLVLPEAFIEFLRAEKAGDAEATVPELIRRAIEHGVLRAEDPIDRTTVWRAVKRMGLPLIRSNKRDADMRRFAYPHRMMMVLADGK